MDIKMDISNHLIKKQNNEKYIFFVLLFEFMLKSL